MPDLFRNLWYFFIIMNDMVFMLVYTSRVVGQLSAESLDNILADSRKNNSRDGIAGFLGFREGRYIQLLEGEESVVRECYSRILLDDRHERIVLQGEAHSSKRCAPGCSMGLVDAESDNRTAENLRKLLDLATNGAPFAEPSAVLTMVRSFSRDAKLVA